MNKLKTWFVSGPIYAIAAFFVVPFLFPIYLVVAVIVATLTLLFTWNLQQILINLGLALAIEFMLYLPIALVSLYIGREKEDYRSP